MILCFKEFSCWNSNLYVVEPSDQIGDFWETRKLLVEWWLDIVFSADSGRRDLQSILSRGSRFEGVCSLSRWVGFRG